MMYGMATDWTKLYQVFDTGPLEANQLQDLYVDLEAVRGENEPGSVAGYLEGSIRNSGRHTCQLVSGHQGSGKSTELRRLQGTLEAGDNRYFCVVCDIENELPLDDMDFPDLLLAIVRQTADALRDRLKIDLKPGYFADRARELKELFGSKVELKEARLDTLLGVMVATLRGSPESRVHIRKALDPKVESLLSAANEVFDQARERIKGHGFGDLVVIVDGSDKLKLSYGPGAGTYPGERLFVHRADQIRGFACHMVYAVPMALAYSPLLSDLESLYGQQTPIIPVTKLHDRQGKRVDAAFDCFREILSKRVVFAGSTMAEVFPDRVVTDELIRLSGGQPRVLCSLARDCLRVRRPVERSVVDAVASREMRAMRAPLELAHWRVLAAFMGGKQPLRTADTREVYRDLIVLRALLHYRNKEEWLGVNPLVGSPPQELSGLHV